MDAKSNNYNEDELIAPHWLDQNFFRAVLEQTEKSKEIKTTDLKITPASAKGEHFASVMFRVQVDYQLANGEEKQKQMIVKTLPDVDGNKKEILEGTHIFETETEMYSKVIPKFEYILHSAAGDETILGAKCLFHSLSPKKVIVLEDIVPLGYKTVPANHMSLDEIKIAFEKLAKWHAISFKINSDEPQFFDEFRYDLFSTSSFTDHPSFNDGVSNFIDMIGEHEDLAKYQKYFEPFANNIVSLCTASFSEYRQNPDASGIYGLCHGDFHMKNLMLKRNEGLKTCEDIKLIDFQFCYMGPLVNDLIYSKFLILNANQRANHWDEILYHYLTIFQKTLRNIDFDGKVPELSDLKRELARQKIFELFIFTTFLPLWDRFTGGAIDMEDIVYSLETRKKMFRKLKYVDEVRIWLPKYQNMGYFEN